MRNGKSALLICVAALLLPWAACAQDTPVALPPLTPDYRPEAGSVEGGLWMQFDQIEKDLAQSPLLIRDPALNAYLQHLACKLIGPQCAGLRVYVVDNPDFNATCSPNGMVEVWSGALLRVENEAQLAFILGHEFTHYLKRHSLNGLESERGAATAALLGRFVMGDAARVIKEAALNSYGRDLEREADAGGFNLAVAAGYDPRQGAAIWRLMAQENKASSARTPSVFFSDHPADSERLDTMAKMADALQADSHSGELGEASFRAAMQPYRAKWLEEELNRNQFGQSIVIIDRLIASDPLSGELQFYLGEAYRRRNSGGDLDRALSAYQAALGKNAPPNAVYRSLGMVALKMGNKDLARTTLTQYLALVPEADDRAMVQIYLTSAGG